MDRTNSNYFNHYQGDSPDHPQNHPCTDFSDPRSLLQVLQNNPNLQDPQCLNKIIIPMLLVQLLQNQQTCQHCPDVNHQTPYTERHRSRRQQPFHDGLQSYHDRRQSYHDLRPSHQTRQPSYHDANPPVQEVSVPPGRYRSNEYILGGQYPPSIQCSDEEIRNACCDSRPDYCNSMRRRKLMPSRSHHYDQQRIASTRSPSPERGIVERCYWCRQQLYRYYDPDLCKRVFTHFPCHRGAILAPAGKSSSGSIRQMSLVDTSPFSPERDMMLPCPYLCAKTETTYNSSFRHPEVVARESVCRLVSKKSQPWEQSSNALFGQSSLESIGHRDKPALPNRHREELVMFVKPNCCPSRARSGRMTNSSLDLDGYNHSHRRPGPCVTLANTSLDISHNSRNRRPEPCVTFSPSTDEYEKRRSIEKEKTKEDVRYYNCRPPQKSKDGGNDLYGKPHPRRHRSSRSCRSSSGSSRSRSRQSRHSHRNASARSRPCPSNPLYRPHSAPHKSRSRGSRRRRPRAKSDLALMGDRQHGRRRHSHSGRRRHRSRSSSRRHRSRSSSRRHRCHSGRQSRRHSRPPFSISDPAIANQDSCEEVVVCCPHRSVYNASYGNPAEHPYYEGPCNPNFRRQRTEMY